MEGRLILSGVVLSRGGGGKSSPEKTGFTALIIKTENFNIKSNHRD